MKKTLQKTLILSAALLALSGVYTFAHAQDKNPLSESQTYDPQHMGWMNPAEEQMREAQRTTLGDKGFITPDTVQVAIVHPSYMDEDQFGLEMSVPDVVSGCFTLTPLEYEARFREPRYLDIKVKHYRRVAPEGPAKSCDKQNQMSTALMVLSKKDLMARQTDEIHFTTSGAKDVYKISINQDRVELMPQTMSVFKAQNLSGELEDRISYSFNNNRMVILQVPMAKPGEDLTQAITMFASRRALSPADPSQHAMRAGNGAMSYYFYDNSGGVIDQIGSNGYADLGQIAVNRPYDGPEGRTATAVPLRVFATRPGTEL